ncbi:hypothetical protein D6783_00655 [Candidatus Woesearchaeota archaeon]|nr:MAG: hypothetical protein D6783_00655 [Candidatus Woesearchaeota archaeon]
MWTLIIALFTTTLFFEIYPATAHNLPLVVMVIAAAAIAYPAGHFLVIFAKTKQRNNFINTYARKRGYTLLPKDKLDQLKTKIVFTPATKRMRLRANNAFTWKRDKIIGTTLDLNISILDHATHPSLLTTTTVITLPEELNLPYILIRARQPGVWEQWALATVPWDSWDVRTRQASSGRAWILLSTDIKTARKSISQDLINYLDSLPWRDTKDTPQTYLEILGSTLKLSTRILSTEQDIDAFVHAAETIATKLTNKQREKTKTP